jgi:uncharacterized membrane protein YjjB (DUF3815 family)|tara:strand:+ start:289 stop:585 length:297 start_codon:yes stop_codon:yes gene_type:complete
MSKSKSPVLMSLGEVLGDFLVGAVVTAICYFAFLAGGHSSPLGAAFGLGAWVFCIWTGVHCMLTDGGTIVIVSMLLGCVGIVLAIIYFIGRFLLGGFG